MEAVNSWHQMREALDNCELSADETYCKSLSFGGPFSGLVFGGLERLAG